MGYDKLPLFDGHTTIDQKLLDHIQDGIVDAHNRADVLERWMNRENYKEISISTLLVRHDFLYGTVIVGTNGGEIKFSVSKDATEVSITTPEDLTYTKKLGYDETGKQRIEVYAPKHGTMYVTGEGTDEEKIKLQEPTGKIVEWAYGEEENLAKRRYDNYRAIKLKANTESTFTDWEGRYILTEPLTWTISAKEADGKPNDDGTIEYGSKSAESKVNVAYKIYYGKSKNANENSEEFIDDTFIEGGNAILSVHGRVTSKSSLDIKFAAGAEDEYLYFALPKAFYESDKTTFDIWKTGYTEEFVLTATVGVRLWAEDSLPADYNLFRSPNKITDKNAFNVKIS